MTSVGDGPLQLQCQHSKLFDRPAASENGPLQLQCQHSETFDRPAASDNGPLQLRCQHSKTFDRPATYGQCSGSVFPCFRTLAGCVLAREFHEPLRAVFWLCLALVSVLHEPLRAVFWHVRMERLLRKMTQKGSSSKIVWRQAS
jgi:hypothetical protein